MTLHYKLPVSTLIVVHTPDLRVLLLERADYPEHWQSVTGSQEPGETLEETGWEPGPLRPLVDYFPTNGLTDQVFHCFLADGARRVGEPTDAAESERIEWVDLEEVRRIVRDHEMLDGLSLTAVLFALAHEL